MPTTLNCIVLKKRALLVYTILKRMTIDVGKIINTGIHALVNSKTKTQSMGFPYLIYTLCIQARVVGSCKLLDRVTISTDS